MSIVDVKGKPQILHGVGAEYSENNKDWCRINFVLIINTIGLIILLIFAMFYFGGSRHPGSVENRSNSVHYNYLNPVVDPNPIRPVSPPDVRDEIEELFSLIPSGSHDGKNSTEITESERNLLNIIFDAYDIDDDNEWSLQEFRMFMEDILDEKTSFHALDVNKDGILSTREVVVSLMHIHDIPAMEEYMKIGMAPMVKMYFNYSYDQDVDGDNQVDQKWFEYAAQFLFRVYDPDRNGYITLDEWVKHQTSDSWYLFNLDENDKITFMEFVSGFIKSGYLQPKDQTQNVIDSIFDLNLHNKLPVITESECQDLVFQTKMTEIYDAEHWFLRRLFLNDYEKGAIIGGAMAVGGILLIFGGAAFGCAVCIVAGGHITQIGFETLIGVGLGAASDGCFGENNLIYAVDHGYIKVKDLMVGDWVLNGDGIDEIWFIDDYNYDNDPFRVMLRLWFDNEEFITITSNHLLYTMDDDMTYLMRAGDFKIGDELIAVNSNYTRINNIDYTVEKVRNPVTMNGDIVVNGILASSYSYSIENAQRLHQSAKVLRWIFKNISPQIAVIITNFSYNIVFRMFRYFGFDIIFDFDYSAPIILTIIAIFIAMAFFIIFYCSKSSIKKIYDKKYV